MRLGAFLAPWGDPATPADFDLLAQGVEDLGYDSLWTGDHVVVPRDVVSPYPSNSTGPSPSTATNLSMSRSPCSPIWPAVRPPSGSA